MLPFGSHKKTYGNCKSENEESELWPLVTSISCRLKNWTEDWKIRRKAIKWLVFSKTREPPILIFVHLFSFEDRKSRISPGYLEFKFRFSYFRLVFLRKVFGLTGKCSSFLKFSSIFCIHDLVEPTKLFHFGHARVHSSISFAFRWQKISSRHSMGKLIFDLTTSICNCSRRVQAEY